jgi:hypothetical protein
MEILNHVLNYKITSMYKKFFNLILKPCSSRDHMLSLQCELYAINEQKIK